MRGLMYTVGQLIFTLLEKGVGINRSYWPVSRRPANHNPSFLLHICGGIVNKTNSDNCPLVSCGGLTESQSSHRELWFVPDWSEHLLSGECPALQHTLHETLSSSLNLLSHSSPLLVPPVLSALSRGSFEWTKSLLNPSVDIEVIRLKQMYGDRFVWPLFRLSRAYIWCMDKEKGRIMKASSTEFNTSYS